jgi:hypothetical protein
MLFFRLKMKMKKINLFFEEKNVEFKFYSQTLIFSIILKNQLNKNLLFHIL